MPNEMKPITGDEHPWDDDDGCWQCGGEGYVYMCFEEYACVDPEGGCDLCARRCDICNPRRPAARPKEMSNV